MTIIQTARNLHTSLVVVDISSPWSPACLQTYFYCDLWKEYQLNINGHILCYHYVHKIYQQFKSMYLTLLYRIKKILITYGDRQMEGQTARLFCWFCTSKIYYCKQADSCLTSPSLPCSSDAACFVCDSEYCQQTNSSCIMVYLNIIAFTDSDLFNSEVWALAGYFRGPGWDGNCHLFNLNTLPSLMV